MFPQPAITTRPPAIYTEPREPDRGDHDRPDAESRRYQSRSLLANGFAIAATIDVTRFDDPPGPCGVDGCSLRQAVLQANLTPGADTITLHAGTYKLKLQGDDAIAAAGDLDITDTLTIDGDPAGGTIINAKGCKDRAFEVFDGCRADARARDREGRQRGRRRWRRVQRRHAHDSRQRHHRATKAGNSGGGIASEAGTCTLTDVVVTQEQSAVENDGGGLEFFPEGTATVLRSTISKNSAGDTGGGWIPTTA